MLKDFKKYATFSLMLLSASAYPMATEMLFLPLPPVTQKNNLSGFVGAFSNQVSEEVGNVPGNRYIGELEFAYHRKAPRVRQIEARFQVAAQVNDQDLAMYSLQEAYLGTHITTKDHVRVGRQVLPWSAVDNIWGFGKVNNRKNFDFFNPQSEGLVGFLYERKSSNGMRYRAFVSGLYVPEMNPGLDIDKNNRSITSRHPWGDAPATSANVEGVNMAVKYDVNYPDISDVIYRYTVGANIGFESKHWVLDNFIMRKPENSITPDVEVNVDFVSNVVNAEIDPRFYYHDVYGSTLKYRNKDLEMYVSGIAIRPNEFPDVDERVRYTEIKNKKRREDYLGGGISKVNDIYSLALNYVARLSPFDREKDDLAPDPRWNQAINFVAARNFGKNYTLMTDVKFDMLTTDRLVMVRGVFRATNQLHMNLGVNMIGTPTDGKSFWSPYTNNDAIYGGLRYVF